MSVTVKQARIGIEATQQEIADKMGIHVQTYARLEKHPEDMTITQAIALANIVKLSVSDFSFASGF